MNENVKKAVEQITKELNDKGLVVEGGWRAYEILTGLDKMSEVQRRECRKAFFFGAHHLFASIMTVLEPGVEETKNDLNRLSLIDAELRKFIDTNKP